MAPNEHRMTHNTIVIKANDHAQLYCTSGGASLSGSKRHLAQANRYMHVLAQG